MLTSNRIQTSFHNNDFSCSYVTHGWPTVANSTLCFVMPLTAPRTFQYNNTSFSSSLPLIQAHKLLGDYPPTKVGFMILLFHRVCYLFPPQSLHPLTYGLTYKKIICYQSWRDPGLTFTHRRKSASGAN